jgi:16S rRNA (cytosine967-C5)-methyltransferase
MCAFRVLDRVQAGGYASDLLLQLTSGLDSRDAGLASEIVLGALRHQAQLDFLIEHYSGRAASSLDKEVRIALRMAIYQIRYLDRIPARAAVDDSVELVKHARKRSATGFANAVLRKVGREPVPWPDRSTELSQPAWLIAEWDAQFGRDAVTAIARAFLRTPDTFVRHPPDRPGLVVEPTDVPGAYRVLQGDPIGLRIQDIGSQAIVPLLDLQSGQQLLDLCAAPGNKTAQAMESGVSVIACDLHWHRIQQMKDSQRVVLDARRPLPFRGTFDRVLVDAPCSGTGTLARNPEIRWKLQPSDITELQAKQIAILTNALNHLRSGGRLVYSTCSLERQENEDVVAAVVGARGDLEVIETVRRTPGQEPGDGFFAAVITSR